MGGRVPSPARRRARAAAPRSDAPGSTLIAPCTLGMVHPQLCSVAQHQSRIKQNPFKTNTTTIQQPHNNHTTTTQQSYNNRNRPQAPRPKGGAGATPRHTALRRGGGARRPTRRAAPTPKTPRAAPAPPLATLRHGAARAAGGLPEGPPQPRRTPRAAPAPPLVILRHGATRAPGGLPEGPPLLSKK